MLAPLRETSPSTTRNDRKMPIARSSVPTHSRHNKPSLLRTFAIAVLYSALASAPVDAQLNLSYVGVGGCMDASGNYYDYVYRQPMVDSSGNQLTGNALLEVCSNWCGQNPNQLIGVMIVESSGYSCYCSFSDPMPNDLTTASYSPAGYDSYNGYAGIGAVTSASGHTGWNCYSVQVRCLLYLYLSPSLTTRKLIHSSSLSSPTKHLHQHPPAPNQKPQQPANQEF